METNNPDAILLTPNADAYISEFSLTRTSLDLSVATWVDRIEEDATLCWRTIGPDDIGPTHKFKPVRSAPGSPKVVGNQMFWLELHEMRGQLLFRDLDLETGEASPVSEVGALSGQNCGEFTAIVDPSGTSWLLCEIWCDRFVELQLLKNRGGEWELERVIEGAEKFCARPQLAVDGDRLALSWDEYRDNAYRVSTLIVSAEGDSLRSLPAPAGHSESLSALAFSRDNALYAARCQEKFVDIGDGIANYHSNLVVARLDTESGDWEDLASVDIDHAMNPWMAAYCGLRRFPSLAGSEQGCWLLWEEKEDVKEMNPPWGRLCAMPVDQPSADSASRVILDKESLLVIESGAQGDQFLVADRTRRRAWQNRIPYSLHQVDLSKTFELRPADLESNKSCIEFSFRSPAETERPRMENGHRLFFGDPHIHSRWSQDLEGEQDELYHLARDIAEIDFIAFTENDIHWYAAETFSEAQWQRNRRNAEFFNRPGKFTAILGWEYTKCGNPETGDKHTSHRCVLLPGDDGQIHCWYEGDVPNPPDLARKLHGEKILLHHHHPNGYDITDDTLERNIEICSGWWNCMDRPEFADKLHELLDQGFQLGFFGGSDNHERTPGIGGALTGVWAEENTREAIFDAFWNRRVFATTGLRPDLRFKVSGCFMGGRTETDQSPSVELNVRCDVPLREARIVRDGSVIQTLDVDELRLDWKWGDEDC